MFHSGQSAEHAPPGPIGRPTPRPEALTSSSLQQLASNTPTAPGDPWSIAHPMAYSAIWILGIVAVCAPPAVRAYQRSIDR